METFVTVRRPRHDYAPLGWFDEARVIDRIDATLDLDLERALRVARPDVVFNCVGIVKQRRDAGSAVGTITVNSLLPHRLAAQCAAVGARLIHLSTDCVFSGSRGAYSESDSPDARDLYGRSKLLGEVNGDGCLTIRTSMVGREIGSTRGLIEWFLSHRGEPVPGFTRARFSGLTTLELSRVLADVAQHHRELHGVWHLAAEPISKYDLLTMVNEHFASGTTLEPDASFVCDRTLDGSRFTAATGYRAPTWDAMVAEMAADPTPYDSWANQWTSNTLARSTASTS
jgi:dTDP-4-dehydrorhamnose reductase